MVDNAFKLSLAGLQQGFLQKQAELQKQALEPWQGALLGGGIGGLGGGGLGHLLGSTGLGALSGGVSGASLGYLASLMNKINEENKKGNKEKAKKLQEKFNQVAVGLSL